MHKLLAAVTVLAVSTAQAGVVIHVDAANCPGPGSGSIRDPYCSIQTAIDNAVDTDEIVVAPGTYFESIDFLGKAIWLRSSDGAEATIIDGTGFFHVVRCVSGEGPDTVLDGFTITGGNADGSFPDSLGGGMYNSESSPTVTNCTFINNAASRGGGMTNTSNSDPTVTYCTFTGNTATQRGGGMHNISNSSPTVTNCTFSGNSASDSGGGMYNRGSPMVTDCTFAGNTAGLFGGGMYNLFHNQIISPTVSNCTFSGNDAPEGGGMRNFNSSPTVTNCTFEGNTASRGGGMTNTSNSDPTVTYCTFTGNTATQRGGGMYNEDSSSPTVTACAFDGNTADQDGGGMYNFLSSPTVTDCRFSGNIAGGDGGGIYSSASDPIVTNCTFSGNTSGSLGGGMANIGGSPTVVNCTFIGNVATFNGGGMFNIINSPTVTNCILWGDSPEEISGGTPTVTYSDVQGGFPGTGNIDADPLFVDPDNGDLHLQPGSPCIDAADNTAVPQDLTTDLDGNPRFLDVPETPDTGNGTLPIVDMGAYESLGGGCLAVTSQQIVCHADGTSFTVTIEGLNACTGGTTQVTFTASGGSVGQELCFTALVNDGGFCCSTEICVMIPDCTPAALPSDLDGDGTVGMTDFLALLGAWGPCSDCGTCPADFDGDCSVGILDLLTLLGNWE